MHLDRALRNDDAGVCQVDDVYAVEWAYIPHLYYDFYVYQYATSVVAAVSLANGAAPGVAVFSHGSPLRIGV